RIILFPKCQKYSPRGPRNVCHISTAIAAIFPQHVKMPEPIMLGFRVTALRTRSGFLIAATIAATACVAAFTFDRAAAQTTPDYASLVAASDRSAADRDADKGRDPTPFPAFAAPRRGMKVLDMGAGAGYSSELMARAERDGICAKSGRSRRTGQSQLPGAAGNAGDEKC